MSSDGAVGHDLQVQKFLALDKLRHQMGFGTMRVMTDVSAERYWTVVSEMEVESLEKYAEMSKKSMELKEFQEAMKGYHDLVIESGVRSIKIEKFDDGDGLKNRRLAQCKMWIG